MKPRYTRADADRFARDLVGVHEAGHAIVAQVLGLRVQSVHVARRDGLVTLDPDQDYCPDEGLIVAYAGYEAGVKYLATYGGYSTSRARRTLRDGARTDLRIARQLARDARISRGTAQRRARRLVNRHWRRICRNGLRWAA